MPFLKYLIEITHIMQKIIIKINFRKAFSNNSRRIVIILIQINKIQACKLLKKKNKQK
jgi:hypothetical protein